MPRKPKATPVRAAMQVVYRPLAELMPYARNPRKHPAAQIAKVKASLMEFGWANPILTADSGVLAGHARLEAAQDLRREGLTIPGCDPGMAPTINLSHLSAAQRKAYVITDNRTALDAEWDDELLKLELLDLKAFEFDLELTGFSTGEIDRLLGNGAGLTDPDEAPAVEEAVVSALGDVWLLGRHRLMCGDSTDAATVERAIGGVKPHLCLTDPPYGIGETDSVKNKYAGYNDSRDNLISTVNKFLPLARHHATCVVLTPGNGNARVYPDPTWTMAWFTPAGVGSGPWGYCCWQPILCYGKDPKLVKKKGRHPDALVHTEAAESFGHPCTKPIKFWSWLMARASEMGESIYDPFVGSGTTIIAAEQTGRVCHAIELHPPYVDVSVRRWQAFAGQQATLEATGATFADVVAERMGSPASKPKRPRKPRVTVAEEAGAADGSGRAEA